MREDTASLSCTGSGGKYVFTLNASNPAGTTPISCEVVVGEEAATQGVHGRVIDDSGAGNGYAGWMVWVDANNNGSLDAGETSVLTDGGGYFTLATPVGTNVIRLNQPGGWGGRFSASVNVASGQITEAGDFMIFNAGG